MAAAMRIALCTRFHRYDDECRACDNATPWHGHHTQFFEGCFGRNPNCALIGVVSRMEDEDSRGATPMVSSPPPCTTRVHVQLCFLNCDTQALLGEVSAVNLSQHVAAKTSPPRAKRVFVLADASRLRAPTFTPTSTAFSGNSPTKSRSQKRDHHASNIAQIGVRSRDDATFLALLHIESLVDRDLFRCAYCARNFTLG
jgi:hypothetical protein